MLQRGRAPESAEIDRHGLHPPNLLAGFNGAALRRARRYPPRPSPWTAKLRCFNGAALRRARRSEGCEGTWRRWLRASTGPRSGERGDRKSSTVPRRQVRRFNGAALRRARRCSRLLPTQSARMRFNGAALRRARRCGRIGPHQIPAEGASTGPRSGERGDRFKQAQSGRLMKGFNGAALRRARRYARKIRTRFKLKGFNGAALRRARRCLHLQNAVIPDALASTGPRSGERGDKVST